MVGELEILKQLIPPPEEPVCPDGDWRAIEVQLGIEFPDDYKRFIADYGSGSLQSFLHIWNYLALPAEQDPKEIIQQITTEYEYDQAAGYDINFVAYPEPGGLIPFASTDDGNYLNWRTAGAPDDWSVVAYDCGSGQLICAEGVGMVACLCKLVQQENPFRDAFCNVDSFSPPITYRP
jgi:hypothetical protein